jgi:hypothetical protein
MIVVWLIACKRVKRTPCGLLLAKRMILLQHDGVFFKILIFCKVPVIQLERSGKS